MSRKSKNKQRKKTFVNLSLNSSLNNAHSCINECKMRMCRYVQMGKGRISVGRAIKKQRDGKNLMTHDNRNIIDGICYNFSVE